MRILEDGSTGYNVGALVKVRGAGRRRAGEGVLELPRPSLVADLLGAKWLVGTLKVRRSVRNWSAVKEGVASFQLAEVTLGHAEAGSQLPLSQASGEARLADLPGNPLTSVVELLGGVRRHISGAISLSLTR